MTEAPRDSADTDAGNPEEARTTTRSSSPAPHTAPSTLREATPGTVPSSGSPAGADVAGAHSSPHETLISSQSSPALLNATTLVTGTQPSMPAFAEPPSSRDLRRVWHVDEQFHRQDARIRLLEKELTRAQRLAQAALGLAIVGAALALRALF